MQIEKWLKDNKPNVTHFLDVWHVAKGLSKKIVALAKRKNCEKVLRWRRSILYHLYQCAATSNGDADLMEAKWSSVTNQICNVYHPDRDLYPACQHL
ncbi:hypothetical protein GJAV_G00081970 [Gymnothorax javanicus]|nr:hypothetical protein GJAV_G00081970 [Gymnothorax javanicus]